MNAARTGPAEQVGADGTPRLPGRGRSGPAGRLRLRRPSPRTEDGPPDDPDTRGAQPGRPWRGRLRRAARRIAVVVAVLVVAGTVFSFGYNFATGRPAARPAGLLIADAGGFATRYRTWGTSGSPIVLVPGAFETADTFAALGDVLGADHRVFAIDLTGTGYSAPSPPFSAGHLADQLIAFLDAERLTGPDAPVLVGHSSGASVVGLATARRPAAVTGVVFLDGDALPLPAMSFARWLFPNPYRTTVLRLGLSSGWLIKQVYRSQCGPSCPTLGPADVDTWRRPLRQSAFEAEIGYTVRHGIPSMSSGELGQLKATTVPKRVVYGVDDPQMSARDAQETAARIGAPPATAIPGRHLTMISSPHQVATEIQALTS